MFFYHHFASFSNLNAGQILSESSFFHSNGNVRHLLGFTGEMIECDEGDLVWLKKEELLKKKMWEGDRIFLKALDERQDFFSLKLRYQGEKGVEWKFGS